jgi:hypothetical protein
MTAAEFEQAYAERSNVTVEWLKSIGRRVVPCSCDHPDCPGWQMGHSATYATDEVWMYTKRQEEGG